MRPIQTHEIRVRGTVQGVGFRPTVFRIASTDRLVGEVFNDAEGVLIRISADEAQLNKFIDKLNLEYPPLAKIDGIECKTVQGQWDFNEFSIRQSQNGAVATEVSADAATCSECLQEIFNANDTRYLYPFTNCTHCGPRLSIVKGIPYDRGNSTMASFPMCDYCSTEYIDPLNRRFHAQPVACFDCGPQISFDANSEFQERQSRESRQELTTAQLEKVNDALLAGKIIAIRGIGGFHLCCDATNHHAVETLRTRKLRYAKPFALMSDDIELVKKYCELSSIEEAQLTSVQAPIVLLNRKEDSDLTVEKLSGAIAPGSNLYGFMMPYTPLHWLICKKFPKPLVMTSGNVSGQPQIIDNQEAQNSLTGIADLILYHNRDIANRIDDSVVRCMAGKARVIRRARGYAPRSFVLPNGFELSPNILACGAELKSTFCLLKSGSALVSQHQGDLEDISTFDDYIKNLELYRSLYDISPELIVADKHPEYVSSKFAKNELMNQFESAQLVSVQHHHAHIASCLLENNVSINTPPVLGLALDGLGFGDDGTLWGGEFLLADYTSSRRVARLKPIAMLGGAQAIKEPWRNTFAHIVSAIGWAEFIDQYGDLELCQFLQTKPTGLLQKMITEGINSPFASSCGRLFDAVAATLGLCRDEAVYEGQGAVELEMMASRHKVKNRKGYTFTINTIEENSVLAGVLEIDPALMWRELLNDIQQGTSVDVIASRFHSGLVSTLVAVVQKLNTEYTFTQVALSGGCMQNQLVLEGLIDQIERAGYECLSQSKFPSNDGGISLGQAAIAAAQAIQH